MLVRIVAERKDEKGKKLEINKSNTTNTITTFEKDNLVLEIK